MNKIITKEVENPYVYTLLKKYQIKNTPHIISVVANTVAYEYIDGIDLDQFQEKYMIDDSLCLHIISSLINILEDLKKHGIVHKDIKPQNIIINYQHEIFLIDFDASRCASDEKNKDTILLGTEGYASPEHYGYFATSYLSDIYSLGKTIEKMCDKQFEQFNPIIEKATQFDPKNRYQDYQDMRNDLKKQVAKGRKTPQNSQGKLKKYIKIYNLKLFKANYPLSSTQIFITIFFLLMIFATIVNTPGIYNGPKDLIAIIFVYWVFIDFIDYIKLVFYLIKDFSKYKHLIWRKILFSVIVFLSLLIIDIAYSSLF